MARPEGSDTASQTQAAASTPLWRSISDDLRERVTRGEFAAEFPGELELAESYGVSRGTIRGALRPLRESGVVSAQRGSRPQVIDASRGSGLGPLHSVFASVEAHDMTQQSTVVAQKTVMDAAAARRLNLADDAPLFYLYRVRLADGEPIGRDEVWMPAGLVEPLLGTDFSQTALYRELRDQCGITLDGGHEEVRADLADADDEALLGCSANQAVLRLQRVGLHEGSPCELRHSTMRADRYAVTLRF